MKKMVVKHMKREKDVLVGRRERRLKYIEDAVPSTTIQNYNFWYGV